MKVYNKEKTQILTEYDLTNGYLIEDTITINQPEIQAVEEQFHYETIKEYENGGKDVKKVVDVAGVEYQPAKTYEEEIYVYIPYTPNELADFLVKNGIVENTADVNRLVIEGIQKALRDDDEFPIRYYSKDEEMSEEGRKADAGECLTDEYIENNMNS